MLQHPLQFCSLRINRNKAGGEIALKLNWLTPSHLEIVVTRIPDFHYRVATYAGVQISVPKTHDRAS